MKIKTDTLIISLESKATLSEKRVADLSDVTYSLSQRAQKAERKADQNLIIGPLIGGTISTGGKFVPVVGVGVTYKLFGIRIGKRRE